MHAKAVLVGVTVLLLAQQQNCAADAPLYKWLDEAQKIESWIIARQQELHRIPELLFNTTKTYAALEGYLTDLGIKHRRPKSGTGLIAEIGTGKTPIVALRSDIDALPIVELGDGPIKSEHVGVSHMCGHDGHMSMLLGGARLLHENEGSLKGTVRLLFQPAEEGGAGGDVMVREGALKDVSAAFGFHVMPHIPTGFATAEVAQLSATCAGIVGGSASTVYGMEFERYHAGVVGSRAGTIMAGALRLSITITGRGGHAAMPHTTRDPVVAASAIVLALQSLVSRETDPLGSSVISITQVNAGTVFNVIPDTVELAGTVRALTDNWSDTLKVRIEEVVKHQALSYGCSGEVDWHPDTNPYYPATVNDNAAHEFASDVAVRLLGDHRVDSNTATLMAGEDFSFIARAVPKSAFLFLGIRNEKLGSVHGLHNAKFKLDPAALKTGAAMHAALASEFLSKQASGGGGSDEL